jgi:hypothetical protein
MATKEQELPGVILYIDSKSLDPCAGDTYKATGTILLTATVTDFDVWEKAVEKLDGMAVYSVSTLPETLVEEAQRRANRAEAAMMQTNEDARARVEELESSLAFRQQEVEQLKFLAASKDQALAEALSELTVLRAFEETMNRAHR